jgi:hypothetical protein
MSLMALRAADLTRLFIVFSSSEVRTSPAITTRLVVARVSQATRTWHGVHAGLCGFLEEQIDDLVGDLVADLVGMAFADGFAGEQVILAELLLMQGRGDGASPPPSRIGPKIELDLRKHDVQFKRLERPLCVGSDARRPGVTALRRRPEPWPIR